MSTNHNHVDKVKRIKKYIKYGSSCPCIMHKQPYYSAEIYKRGKTKPKYKCHRKP